MKRTTLITYSLLLVTCACAPLAQASEMYYNRLSAGEVVIPAGTYGDIVVPEGGYKATQFPSALGTISQATGDFGGSYAKIITTVNKNNDLMDHTISGWFKVPSITSGETTLCVEKTSSSYANSRGNAIRVSAAGNLLIGKVKSTDAWQDSGTHITSTGRVPTNEWFYLTVAITVDHATRTATAKAYTNGVEFVMPTTAFACNYNGASCAALKVGDNVECAGLRVDDAVIDNTATMKAWAVDSRYVVQPAIGVCVWTGAALDGDPANGKNWTGGVAPVKDGVFTRDIRFEARADWRSAAVPSAKDVTVDLNGQTLMVPNFSPFVGATLVDASEGTKGTLGVEDGVVQLESGTMIPAGATLALGGTATLDANGKGGKFRVMMANGATLANTGGGMGYKVEQLSGGLALSAGATAHVSPKNEMSSTNKDFAEYPIDMNGGTIVKQGTGKWGVVNAKIAGGGKIVVEQGEFNIGNKGFTCNADFVIEARKDSTAFVWVEGATSVPMIVGDGYVASNGKALSVTNRLSGLITLGRADGKYPFKSTAKLTLAGGATLDLTQNTAPYTPQANFAFGAGTITVDIHGRRLLGMGDKIIAWTAIPEGVTFVFDAETARLGVKPVVNESGLFYGEEIATATWNGGALGDVTDAKNWECRNAQGQVVAGVLPGRNTSVTMTVATMPTSVPAGKDAICGVVSISGKLTRDIDWSGYQYVTFASGSSLDLNGHTFKIGHLGDFDGAMAFTDSASTKGRLDVAAGTVKLRDDFTIAEGITLRLGGAATLDENGTIDTAFKLLMADGAILTNTGTGQGYKRAQITGGITLEANATAYVSPKKEISSTATSYATYSINLNGGTLVKQGAGKWGLVNVNITGGGTIVVEQGELNIGNRGFTCNADFVFETRKDGGGFVFVDTATSVPTILGDGYVASDGATLSVTKRLSGLITLGKANGTYPFSPTAKLTLAGGATLDLTQNAEPYVTHANFAFGAGTITVDLEGRDLAADTQVVAWKSIPPGSTFAWDAETAKSGVRAVVGTTGLYYGCDPDSPVVDAATWTNAAGDGDAMNPQNWSCRNLGGNAVAGGLPTNAESRVVLTAPLSADLDWTKLGPVNFAAGTVDLNGHVLSLARFGDFCGGFSLADARLSTKPGALELADGISKLPEGFTSDDGVVIRTLGGATLDLNGIADTRFKLEMYDGSTLGNGGIVLNGGPVIGGGIALAAGAMVTIDCASATYLRVGDGEAYPIALNGGTIVKQGAKIAITHADVTGPGTIRVVMNELNLGSGGARFDDDVIVEIMKGNSAFTWAQADVTLPNVMGDGYTDSNSGGYTVTRRYSGLLAVSGVGVTFADGMTLDLSQNTDPYALPDKAVIGKGAKIVIDVGDRVLQAGDKLLSCDAKRIAEVSFALPGQPFHLVRKADGLYVYILPMVFVL